MAKTFNNLREEQLLNEFRVIRAGAALLYASKVKDKGGELEKSIRDASSEFNRARQLDDTDAKIDKLMDGLEHIGKALINNRLMLGNMTAISVVATLLAERSNKEIQKLMKGIKRRR